MKRGYLYRSKIESDNKLVIPSELLQSLSIKQGDTVELFEHFGYIIIASSESIGGNPKQLGGGNNGEEV